MSFFPFETRGSLDDDPIIKYSKQDFTKVFRAYLNQSGEFNTELDEIIKTKNPDKNYIKHEWASIGELQFKYIGGEWKVYFAFLRYETIDSLKE